MGTWLKTSDITEDGKSTQWMQFEVGKTQMNLLGRVPGHFKLLRKRQAEIIWHPWVKLNNSRTSFYKKHYKTGKKAIGSWDLLIYVQRLWENKSKTLSTKTFTCTKLYTTALHLDEINGIFPKKDKTCEMCSVFRCDTVLGGAEREKRSDRTSCRSF